MSTYQDYRKISEYHPNFLPMNSDEIENLINSISWRQDEISMFGKTHKIPRHHAWYADSKANYSYSGIELPINPWTKLLSSLKRKVEEKSGLSFNGVLLNLYKDGQHSNGWHADDERELVKPIGVASLSFGAEREFQIRQKGQSKIGEKLLLESGSLFIMKAPFQEVFQHQIAKSKKVKERRINLTFRQVRLSD